MEQIKGRDLYAWWGVQSSTRTRVPRAKLERRKEEGWWIEPDG